MTADRYPLGATLVFMDANATVSDSLEGAVRAPINGPPIMGDGAVIMIPVFAARDNGREATTVYVHVTNVLGVE